MWFIFQNHFTKTGAIELQSSDSILSMKKYQLAIEISWNYDRYFCIW